jgi:dTDP-4-dehydrorhamnose 3,5-epimerase
MIKPTIEGIIVTPLNRISVPEGNVFHAMKRNDPGFSGFGEAYFSSIAKGAIKGWKRHKKMSLNLVVPVGAVRFVMFDDRDDSASYGIYQEVVLSKENYCRLTVPPMIWMGFQCVDEKTSIVLNIANIPHSQKEQDAKSIEEIEFDWSLNK